MSNIRWFSQLGVPMWVPAASLAEGAPILSTKEQDGETLYLTYSSFVL